MNNWIRVNFIQIQLRNIIIYVDNIDTNFRRGRLSIWVWCSCSYLNIKLDHDHQHELGVGPRLWIFRMLGEFFWEFCLECLGLKSYLLWTVFNSIQNHFSQIYVLNLQGSSRYLWFYIYKIMVDEMYNYSNGWYNIWYGYPVWLQMDILVLAQLRFYKYVSLLSH